MFTKQHYKAIAEIVSNQVYEPNDLETLAVKWIAEDLAEYYAEDNPNFNRDKFIVACGLE